MNPASGDPFFAFYTPISLMETQPLPDLLLLHEPLAACPFTGEPIHAVQAEMTLLGPEPVEFSIVLGRSTARWYAIMPALIEKMVEEGWGPDDVAGFEIDGQPVEVALWDEASHRAMRWADFCARTARARGRASEPPPPPEAVRRLSMLQETWQVAARGIGWIHDEEPPRPSFLALVVDDTGRIRHSHICVGEAHNAGALAAAVRAATRAEPDSGIREGRPRTLQIADVALADALAEALAPAGITVEHAATPQADEALGSTIEHLGPPLAAPFFQPWDQAEVRAYFKAARRFYRARPWQRLRGDRYIAFRVGEGLWFYANVMGQIEEEPGLSLFDSWLRLCRFIHNEPTFFDLAMGMSQTAQLEAAGALEGITLFPLSTLLPEDAAFLHTLGIAPIDGNLYPLPVRYTPEGLSRVSFPLPFLTALMEALVAVVASRRAQQITSIKQTVEAAGLTVMLRYPARADEPLEGQGEAGTYRLVAEGQDSPYVKPIPAGERVEIDAPGTATLATVIRALRAEIGGDVWFSGFGAGDFYLWHARTRGAGIPAPRVADLYGLAPLWLESMEVRYPVHITPLPGETISEVQVRRR